MKGSGAYANDHRTDDIRGMISADMIAFNPYEETDPNYHKARIGYARVNTLTGQLAAALDLYGGLSAEIHRYAATDHVPFDEHGFNAASLMEYALPDNPNYHRWSDSVDTPDYINYPYAANMTRGIVGYLATAAVPVPEPGSLVLLILGTGGTWILIGRRGRHR